VNLAGYDDTLRLWKVNDGTVSSVVNSQINWQTTVGTDNTVKIEVERDIDGAWFVSVYNLNEDLIGSGSGNEMDLFPSGWFNIYYKYSSARDRLLWFDDLTIDGIFHEDNEAPIVISCETTGINSVKITLNEQPSGDFILPDNFSLNNTEIRSISVEKISDITYQLEFPEIINNKTTNILKINSICDVSGNCSVDIQIPFNPVWAEPGDVIISEIMADPLPEVSLPDKEYLELTNRTENSFNLKNWRLTTADQSYLFPEVILEPLEIRIICLSKDTSLYANFGKVTGLKQFPSLTDGGRIISLSDSSGNLIHGVDYSSEWYGNELKSDGGWSLEMIDIEYPFYDEGNWTASLSRKGGTPGLVNSVSCSNPDVSFYGVKNVFPEDSINITVRFSEPVFNISENISSIRIENSEVSTLIPNDLLFREYRMTLREPISRGIRYNFIVSADLEDFAGNKIQAGTYIFGLTEPASELDILFNELLFNPFPGDPDYLELFNGSEKVIDPSRLQLASVNDDTGDTTHLYMVSDEKRCIMPGMYYALTTDRDKIIDRYFSADAEYIFETGSLPSMSDASGHLVLFNKELDIIDDVKYDEDMHFSLLSGHEGVALEKTGPFNKSGEAANWHSASESAGWGTPGRPNSVFTESPESEDVVILSSARISPDSDGYEDILTISFKLSGNVNVVSVMIFDETGSYVRKVAANMLAGPEASLVWDGTADDGSLVNTGIYIVLITLFDDTGKTERWKRVCTVLR
jgi:hypothetical protein